MDNFGILNLLTRFFDFYLKNKSNSGGFGGPGQDCHEENCGRGYGNECSGYNDCGYGGNGEHGDNGRQDGFCNDGDCGRRDKKDDPLSNLFNIINEGKSDGGGDGGSSGGFGGGGLFGNLAGGLQKLLSGLSKFGNFGGGGAGNRQASCSDRSYGNGCRTPEGGRTNGGNAPRKDSPQPPDGGVTRQSNNRQPLQAAMLATMSAHDSFIKRVKEKHGV